MIVKKVNKKEEKLLKDVFNDYKASFDSSEVNILNKKDNAQIGLKKRVFETGAQRDDNSTKPYVHNLKGYTRLRFGYHMTKGANKYGDSNWELGMPDKQYIESMDRHWSQYLNGDRSEDHLSAFLFGINGLMDNERKNGIEANYYFKQ